MTTLWSLNTPASFWQCRPNPAPEAWRAAVEKAAPVLGAGAPAHDLDALLAWTLGEGQFGPQHWQLSRTRDLYYKVKPLIPRPVIRALRRVHSEQARDHFALGWPVEDRFARFQWDIMRHLLIEAHCPSISHIRFWPIKKHFAFVLTHDVELDEGQHFVRKVADLEERFGFRSSFNFVPERYPIQPDLLDELRERGFEVGIHGLYHDGKLFSSYNTFMARAQRINRYLKSYGAKGFRSPCTLRQPEWMQALDVAYDLSFFDTDPYEPTPGGTMSLWPFILGHFVELPYTLVQDHTLTVVLGQSSPQIWLDKVAIIRRYHGLALVNSHPDYLRNSVTWRVYESFLEAMSRDTTCWHALPHEVARWWRERMSTPPDLSLPEGRMGSVVLTEEGLEIA